MELINLFRKKPKSYPDIDPRVFKDLQNKGGVVLDVRAPQELSEGSIPGYELIDFFDPGFRDKLEQLDPEKTYLLYCRSGNRSGKACTMMKEMGFKRVYNLEGGIKAWNNTF